MFIRVVWSGMRLPYRPFKTRAVPSRRHCGLTPVKIRKSISRLDLFRASKGGSRRRETERRKGGELLFAR